MSNSTRLYSVQLSKALTVKRIDFESVGGGCSVRGPSDAKGVVANIVSVQVCHVQVHYMEELFSIVLVLFFHNYGLAAKTRHLHHFYVH